MFVRLVGKELKYLFKSVIFYLLLAVIFLFYITQFAPPAPDSTFGPVDEMHFIYSKLQSDYEKGMLSSVFLGISARLSEEQRQFIKEAMDKMAPEGLEDKRKGEFAVSYEDYLQIMSELDSKLGGSTYYGDGNRMDLLNTENRYGYKPIDNPEEEMRKIFAMMYSDYSRGEIASYKWIMGRTIRLSEEQKSEIRKAMDAMSPDGFELYSGELKGAESSGKKDITFNVTYEQYLNIVRNLDKKLGGGTNYGDMLRGDILTTEKTYEEAAADFKVLLEKDRLTNAYAREYADYMGITAGFFPVFLAAFLLIRDKRSRMHELIYSRSVSSSAYVWAKYTALVAVVFLCYLVTASYSTYVFARIAAVNGYQIDYLAFYKYAINWILPTVLFTVSAGMLMSTLFGNGIAAIPIQFVIWIVSLWPLKGDYRLFKFVIRYNEVSNYNEYMRWAAEIGYNRLFFVFISLTLVGLTTLIWSWKRGGSNVLPAGFAKRCKA